MPSEIVAEFIDDAREHLAAAMGHLLTLEADPAETDELHGLLRSLHSIKGNAGFLGLNDIYGLLHKAENVLQTVREESCADCPPELMDVMFRVLDTMEDMIDNLQDDRPSGPGDLRELLAALEAAEASIAPVAKAHDRPATAPEPPAPRTTPPELEDDFWPEDASPPAEAVADEPGPPAPAAEGIRSADPAERMAAKMDGLAARLEEEAADAALLLSQVRGDMNLLRGDLDYYAGPNSRQALNLIREYLADLHVYGRPVSGSSRVFLQKLVRNLNAWLQTESLSAGGNGMETIALTADDLDRPEDLKSRCAEAARRGRKAVVFDLRGVDSLQSPQIGALISAAGAAPDSGKVGLIFDPGTQQGLRRVFEVMRLNRVFLLFDDPAKAAAELG